MITSKQNKIVKEIIKLKTKKFRENKQKFYVEGKRIIDEIPKNIKVDKYIFSSEFYEKNREIYKNSECIVLSDDIFKEISDTENPQGIMAICKMQNLTIDNLNINGNFVILDRITDPGNLGTIIRTAEALGIKGIFLSKGCVDIYNPKVIRATMGAIFHIPIFENCDLEQIITYLKQSNIKIVCTYLESGKSPYDVNLKNTAVIIGNEANGVLEKYVKMSDELIKINMEGKVESINASVSSAIIFYEMLRQNMR